MRAIPDDYIPSEDENYGESKMLKTLIDKDLDNDDNNQFYMLYFKCFDIVKSIKNCFALYLYMCENVTRGKSRKGSNKFWNENVLPYYHQGYLPFAKHESHIAKDLEITKPTVSAQLDILLNHQVIVKLAEIPYPNKKSVTVYSVGRWKLGKWDRRLEKYYLQSLRHNVM